MGAMALLTPAALVAHIFFLLLAVCNSPPPPPPPSLYRCRGAWDCRVAGQAGPSCAGVKLLFCNGAPQQHHPAHSAACRCDSLAFAGRRQRLARACVWASFRLRHSARARVRTRVASHRGGVSRSAPRSFAYAELGRRRITAGGASHDRPGCHVHCT